MKINYRVVTAAACGALAVVTLFVSEASAQYRSAAPYANVPAYSSYRFRTNPGYVYGSGLGTSPWAMGYGGAVPLNNGYAPIGLGYNVINNGYSPVYSNGYPSGWNSWAAPQSTMQGWNVNPYQAGNYSGFQGDVQAPQFAPGYQYNNAATNTYGQQSPNGAGNLTVVQPAGNAGYQSYYPQNYSSVDGVQLGKADSAQGNAHPNAVAHVSLRVPADAEVWFDGVKMSQQGADRRFVTPPLEFGHNYSYELKAKWTENGKEVNKSDRITVKAGSHVEVNMQNYSRIQEIQPK